MQTLPEKSESAGKGRYRLKFRSTECLNCGHPLDISDRYCPNCSQANSTKKLSIKDFLDEFFSSLISYDSKLLNTLGALLLRPGKITRDYINGKRVSYTNPFRFLLSLAIIYFLMVNYAGNFSDWDRYGTKRDTEVLENFKGIPINISISDKKELSQELDSLSSVIDLDAYKAKVKLQDSLTLADPTAYFAKLQNDTVADRFSEKQKYFRNLISNDSIYRFQDAVSKYNVDDNFENKVAFNLANGVLNLQNRPGSFISALISKLPFAVFFFLPVFALFMSLVYIRKRYSYTDHLIFSFHNTALLFILLIISYLIDSIFDVDLNWIFLAIFSVYLFMAMRKFYKQGVFKTIVKYVFLNSIFFILALFTVLILLTGNIFTFQAT